MAGHDAPAADGVVRHAPGHHGRAVAGGVVALAGFQVPVVGFFQPGKTGGAQPAFGRGSGVERGDGFLQKFYEIIVHRSVSPLEQYSARLAVIPWDGMGMPPYA